MTTEGARPPLLERYWVMATLLLAVCVLCVVVTSVKNAPYWGQPEVRVTVTEVVYRDGENPGGEGRCHDISKFVVADSHGRSGVLYECGSFLSVGDTAQVRWHPEEDRARVDVVTPAGTLAIGSGIYAVLMAVGSTVWLVQRRRRRATAAV